jgi:hypothetical protein
MTVQELLRNKPQMKLIKQLASSGASLGVIEAKLKMRQGTLRRWLDKGRVRKSTPYHILFNEFRSWAADARLLAEQQQLAKTPSQWLERNTSSKIVEEPDQPTTLLSGVPAAPPDTAKLQASQTLLLAGLRALVEAGISLETGIKKQTVEGIIINAEEKET